MPHSQRLLLKMTFFIVALLGLHFNSLFGQSASTSEPKPSGTNFIPDLLTIGNPNNASQEDTGLGSVTNSYKIGLYDVTVSQYCYFLNAVANYGDTMNLYNTNMATDYAVASIICCKNTDTNNPSVNIYLPLPGTELWPVVYVTLYSALRYCNWLENGQPKSVAGQTTTTEGGAYTLTSDSSGKVSQWIPVTIAQWHLPSLNEWYKAAYYDVIATGNTNNPYEYYYWNYPTCNDETPSNSLSQTNAPNAANFCATALNGDTSYTRGMPPYLTPVGTFSKTLSPWGCYDMGGEVYQWSSATLTNNSIVYNFTLGSSWNSPAWNMNQHNCNAMLLPPSASSNEVGFRVAKLLTTTN